MTYQRKTEDTWEVMGNYGYGWECVTTETNLTEARKRVKEYRENERGVSFQINLKRERILA